jgi:hypothetical protein
MWPLLCPHDTLYGVSDSEWGEAWRCEDCGHAWVRWTACPPHEEARGELPPNREVDPLDVSGRSRPTFSFTGVLVSGRRRDVVAAIVATLIAGVLGLVAVWLTVGLWP